MLYLIFFSLNSKIYKEFAVHWNQYIMNIKFLFTSQFICFIPFILISCQSIDKATRDKWVSRFTGCYPPEEEVVVIAKPPAETKKEEVKKEEKKEESREETAKLEKVSDMLDKMYDNMKDNFENSGLKLEKQDDGLRGPGFSLDREKDEKKRTKKILISFDGDMSFPSGSSKLTDAAYKVIDQIGKAMNEYPDTNVVIYGHTDSVGSKALNYKLSGDRAAAVKKGLMDKHKIAEKRFREIKGYADDRKIINTMAAEPRNRRVEIKVAAN